MLKFLENLDQINPQIVYVILAVALIFPVLKPIGLPLSIDQQLTMPVYNWIEGLNPGDIVIFDAAYSGGSSSELDPQLRAWFTHCMMKGVKVVGLAQWEQGSALSYNSLKGLCEQLKSEGIPCEYGVDWVMPGYKAGGGPTWRSMQDDFWTACGNVDWEKTDFSQLPLLQRLKKWTPETVKGVICFSAGSPGIPTFTQYFPDHNLYVGDVAVQVAGTSNLLRSGQVKGIIPGLSGAAQYEKLIERPGLGVKLMDAQSLGHAIIIILVVLGNIGYRLKMRNTQKRA